MLCHGIYIYQHNIPFSISSLISIFILSYHIHIRHTAHCPINHVPHLIFTARIFSKFFENFNFRFLLIHNLLYTHKHTSPTSPTHAKCHAFGHHLLKTLHCHWLYVHIACFAPRYGNLYNNTYTIPNWVSFINHVREYIPY